MNSRFIGAHGDYLSVHWGRSNPSPVLVIVKAALKLMEAGEKLNLSPGVTKHSLRAMVSHWGGVGVEVQLSRTHVEDVLMVWSKIKDNPKLYRDAMDLYDDKETVEQFLDQARLFGL
jgi:hypothetical protein